MTEIFSLLVIEGGVKRETKNTDSRKQRTQTTVSMSQETQADLNTRMRISNRADSSTLKIMLTFTIMMVTVPIFSYFASKYAMEGLFQMESAYLYAAGIAVIVVHIILVMFVMAAWREDTKEAKKD